MELNPYILPPDVFMREFKRLNPELWHEWELKWAKQDASKLATYNKWRKNHPKEYRAIQKRYTDKPEAKELKQVRSHRRRTLELGCSGSHTVQEWKDKLSLYGYRCAYCGRKTRLSRDHIVSLTNGGTNDISNIIPVCKRCNSSKGNRDELWFKNHVYQMPLGANYKEIQDKVLVT